MVDMSTSIFAKAKLQICIVHVARNISHKVRVVDRAKVFEGFKIYYRADDWEAGRVAIDNFTSKWKNHI